MSKFIYITLISITIFSCSKNFDTATIPQALKFSKDTIYFDTIFSNIGSSTRVLKVYNTENKRVRIPYIKLGMGDESKYRININGVSGNEQENIEIPPNDSIFIFIETTIDYAKIDNHLYVDSLVFKANSFEQNIKLVSLVKDAIFLFPKKGDSSFYIEDKSWTKDKPYVIYGTAKIREYKTLEINAGTHIYFHSNSNLQVSKGAKLLVNGKLGEEVIFDSDRLEPEFSDTPGQWGGINIQDESKANIINYSIIKNSTIGIISIGMDDSTPTLNIKNTQIYNSSLFGILAENSYIHGENIVISNGGKSSLYIRKGGKYNFIHSTFVNHNDIIAKAYTVYISDIAAIDKKLLYGDLVECFFGNCILYGYSSDLSINNEASTVFNYKFENSLISCYSDNECDFERESEFFENVTFNEPPNFKDIKNNNLRLSNGSTAIGMGDLDIANKSPKDILQQKRNIKNKVDIGAYQLETN